MEPLRYVPSRSLRPRCSVCTVLLLPYSCFVVVADDNDGVEAAADNWPVRRNQGRRFHRADLD